MGKPFNGRKNPWSQIGRHYALATEYYLMSFYGGLSGGRMDGSLHKRRISCAADAR